jgi:hypothetical protein
MWLLRPVDVRRHRRDRLGQIWHHVRGLERGIERHGLGRDGHEPQSPGREHACCGHNDESDPQPAHERHSGSDAGRHRRGCVSAAATAAAAVGLGGTAAAVVSFRRVNVKLLLKLHRFPAEMSC